MSEGLAVEVRNLRKTFGKNVALESLSFTLAPGSVTGFIGPNGAGKTTALRIMATLIEPDSGDVLVGGVPTRDNLEAARRAIGFMPDALPDASDITVREYLDFFGRAYGLDGGGLLRRVSDVAAFTGLGGFDDKTLAALSKGMRQRVSLGRALMHDPAALLLDEPAAGLDPRARCELAQSVGTLAKAGKTILISSHILSELAEMCTAFIVIERGVLRKQVTRAEMDAAHVSLQEMFLASTQGELA